MIHNLKAYTHYGDVRGTTSIDWDHGVELGELITKYCDYHELIFPVAVGIEKLERSEPVIVVYAVEGIDSHDELVDLKRKSEGLPVRRFDLRGLSIQEFFSLAKRFSMIAKVKGVQDIDEFDVKE